MGVNGPEYDELTRLRELEKEVEEMCSREDACGICKMWRETFKPHLKPKPRRATLEELDEVYTSTYANYVDTTYTKTARRYGHRAVLLCYIDSAIERYNAEPIMEMNLLKILAGDKKYYEGER